ncbi:MAG TPA: glycosyltransferase [Silvibacterium sp.]|nr:glycosyltransferase [Silvibacterium sp.]
MQRFLITINHYHKIFMTSTTKKKRIAYFLSQYPAVPHTFFLNEILGLRSLDFEIETASVNPPDRSLSQLPSVEAEEAHRTYYLKRIHAWKAFCILATVTFVRPGVILHGLKAAVSLGNWGLYRKLYAFFYMIEAILLGHWMHKRGLHHLHAHFGGPVSTVAMIAAEAWQFDYSLTIHGPEEFYEVDLCYLRRKIERAKFIFCISDFCRSQLMKCCDPALWDKIHVVRLGVDLEEFRPTSREASLPLQIVCVGRLVPAKGQHILLRAFSLLRSKGHPLHLTLVGDGPDRPSLEREVAELSLTEQVTFRGAINHDQVREQIARADVFAMASFAEGIPVALMEAMATQIPCVSTNVAGIPELIRDNVDGLLVPPSSAESLAAAIESLVLDPIMRERLSTSARARVIERYNLADNLKVLASAFESCLS